MLTSPPLKETIEALRMAKEFMKAAEDDFSRSPSEHLPYYMFAQRKSEGFDAILEISEGDKWGCETRWYALRGTPEQIAASIHNEKQQTFCKGPDYYSVDLVLDLHRPIESQLSRNPDRRNEIVPAFHQELQKIKETYGDQKAPEGAHYEQFSRFTMLNEIEAATPSLTP